MTDLARFYASRTYKELRELNRKKANHPRLDDMGKTRAVPSPWKISGSRSVSTCSGSAGAPGPRVGAGDIRGGPQVSTRRPPRQRQCSEQRLGALTRWVQWNCPCRGTGVPGTTAASALLPHGSHQYFEKVSCENTAGSQGRRLVWERHDARLPDCALGVTSAHMLCPQSPSSG